MEVRSAKRKFQYIPLLIGEEAKEMVRATFARTQSQFGKFLAASNEKEANAPVLAQASAAGSESQAGPGCGYRPSPGPDSGSSAGVIVGRSGGSKPGRCGLLQTLLATVSEREFGLLRFCQHFLGSPLAPQQDQSGHPDDAQVEPQRGVADVP